MRQRENLHDLYLSSFVFLFLFLNFSECSLHHDRKEFNKYILGEDVFVYDQDKHERIFTLEEGELVLLEQGERNAKWKKILFEGKIGYLPTSTQIFPLLSNQSELKFHKYFLVNHKKRIPLCKRPTRTFPCDQILTHLNYLDKLIFLKAYYINYTGTWIKIKKDDFIGFVRLADTVPGEIFNPTQVHSFQENFRKICPVKEKYNHVNAFVCFSTKRFLNGDAGEEWKERVYFKLNENSNQFQYGRKYIETFGIIYDVEQINKSRFRILYLDEFDYSENDFYVDVQFEKKLILGPMPETLMKGTYKQVSDEKLVFKTGLNYFK